ncbi:hypothetical protein [Oceanobacillus sp. J11TS1]|uniref:hypothetical protein n=1 Tax=Oceanobacillus sp. J11TS1 TaxID=2807191 RepID=UPI001B17BCEB|nr:hypothetical protein [Oceanobacillus sp. J11TS1]GIO22615.1 hypothetical protein J11TS1_11960 [Oceanobacillus sp. J11TS1]
MKYTYLFALPFIFLLLSGCMYPQSERAENQVPNEEQLAVVQQAVETYREEEGGLVPIQTKGNDTPIFEKYLIDFKQMQEKGYLTEIPGNAFEEGGVYQYVIVDPENDLLVRLIDLQATEQLRSVNIRLDVYRQEHTYPAFGEKISDQIYTVDYEKLGLKEAPTVTSPYSQADLPIVMDLEGNLYIDYSYDLNQALEEYDHDYREGDDIRYLLVDHAPFVPVYSLPYTIKDGQAVFMEES